MKRAEDGNYGSSDSQIARKVLESDFTSSQLRVRSFSDVSEDPNFNCSNMLPLNNRFDLEKMKDLNVCREPGTILYMTFDVDNCGPKEYFPLKEVNEKFLANSFTFRINVIVHIFLGINS